MAFLCWRSVPLSKEAVHWRYSWTLLGAGHVVMALAWGRAVVMMCGALPAGPSSGLPSLRLQAQWTPGCGWWGACGTPSWQAEAWAPAPVS